MADFPAAIRSLGKLNTTRKVAHGSPQLTSGQHVVNITINYPLGSATPGRKTRERERGGGGGRKRQEGREGERGGREGERWGGERRERECVG